MGHENIKFIPEGLRGIVFGPFAQRRLRKKEALVVARDSIGEITWQTKGFVLDVYNQALAHVVNHPLDKITLIKDRHCS